MSKKLSQILKHLEISLHYLHEDIREHNKDYFSDEGQEYPVPTIVEKQKDVKNKITEKYIAVREKNKPWVQKLNPKYNPNKTRR